MRLSKHYELQSMADIGRAQAIARVDQSGHALGTAMYLAQQSVEKQLKSIMVRLDEALGLGSIDKVLRGLSHEFYPSLYEIYRLHVECQERALRKRYGFKPDPEILKYTESVARDFRDASSYWSGYRGNHDILRLTWLQGLGVMLSKKELHRLNRWHGQQIEFVSSDMPVQGEGEDRFADWRPPADMIRMEILDDSALARHIVEYAQTPANAHSRMVLAGTLHTTSIDHLQLLGEKHADMQTALARMGLSEFGLHVVASMTQQYILLYPHNSIGRYPEPAGNGLFTPDIYKRQANHVLSYLFVVVPYHLGELRKNSGIICKISEKGRRLGYWGARPARPQDRRRSAERPRKRRGASTRGRHQVRAADMGALALRYARQADSDMRHAHAAARAGRSGYALAGAMLMGQQSLEKHLKAAVLLAAGMLGADEALGIFGARGHDVYRWVFGLYACHVDRVRAPGVPGAPPGTPGALDSDGLALAVEGSAGFWWGYSKDHGLQELAWRHSIGAPLGKGGQARLDAGLVPCAREAGVLAGDPGIGMPQLAREAASGGQIRDEAMSPEALGRRRRAHKQSRWNRGMRAAVDRRHAAYRATLPHGSTWAAGPRPGARDAPPGRLAAEFCLASLAMLGPGYLAAYPHNSLGRYPGVVGDGVTTDLYRSHADGVRHLLFVDIPCQAWQIARVAAYARMLHRGRGAPRGRFAPWRRGGSHTSQK